MSPHRRRASHRSAPFSRSGSFGKRQTSRTASVPSSASFAAMARPLSAPRSKARYCLVTQTRLRQALEPDVAELYLHRIADVHLKPDQAAERAVLRIVVHDNAR